MAMLRWAYTDELELSEDDAFLIDLMKLANRFQLLLLRERLAVVIRHLVVETDISVIGCILSSPSHSVTNIVTT